MQTLDLATQVLRGRQVEIADGDDPDDVARGLHLDPERRQLSELWAVQALAHAPSHVIFDNGSLPGLRT
jgi:hypothetical protein